MAILNNMRIGWVGFIYQPPKEIECPVEKVLWQLDQAKRLDCHVLQPVAPLPKDNPEALAKIKAKMAEYDVEFELPCPRAIFELAGPNGEAAKKELQAEIDFAKSFGAKIMRTGYGKLIMETTRFYKGPAITGKEQYDNIIACLKIAAPMFEAAGMYYAQENHLDFTGRELAAIFEEINSPNMGIALDTANGFCIFSDPNEEIQLMAPWAITSHIKDTRIEDKTQEGDYFPLIPVGCALGEGNIDIPAAIEAIRTKARYPEGFHLIVEQGWFAYQLDEAEDKVAFAHEVMERSIAYLKKLVTVD